MKRLFAFAGALALAVTPVASFADHLEPKESEIRMGGNLSHTNLSGSHELNYANLTGANLRDANLSKANLSSTKLRGADLSDANLRGANLRDAKLRGVTATDLRGCPWRLPSGWRCFDYSLIQF